jgi:putative transcription factor
MICELCGKEVSYLKPFLIEGSLLKVCPDCAKFGTEKPREPGAAGAGGGARSSGGSSGMRGGYRDESGYTTGGPTKDEIIHKRLESRQRRMKSKDIYDQGTDKELVEDYHKRIQQARDHLGWNQEELGQKINERKSIISKLESRSIKPDDKLVRKLEKALNIKLMESIE